MPYSIASQSDFLRLRTVCQTFNKVFQQYVHLSKQIPIHDYVKSCQLPSMLEWLRCHRAYVKHLVVEQGSPWQEVTLAALLPTACLENVRFCSTAPDTAMFLLSTFKTIMRCSLSSSIENCLNLQPLSSLPLLTTLALQWGYFTCLEAAAHLTALSLDRARVMCMQDCSCAASLVKLDLYDAQLLRFLALMCLHARAWSHWLCPYHL